MEESPNPYEPPKSNLDISVPMGPDLVSKVYSPGQGYAATWLGGPLVGIYFISENFKALNQREKISKYVIGGLIFTFILIFGAPFIPEHFPRYILPLAYSYAFRWIIDKHQFSKEQIASSPNLAFQSNWKVFGLSMLSLSIFLVAIILLVFLYQAMGIA